MAIPVKLQVFEGPLDLLLHLIDKNKINIYDIPILEITDQYLEYVRNMEQDDMNVTSEFMVMAATLLDIKSRMLLPKVQDEDEEEEDPREELVRRLLEYRKFKYMAQELEDRSIIAAHFFYKEKDLPKEVEEYREPLDYGKLLGKTTLDKLGNIFRDVINRQKFRVDPVRSGFGTIEREEVNAENKELYIRAYLAAHKTASFRKLLEHQNNRFEIIVAFLIILELIKTGEIRVEQEETFGDIIIHAENISQKEQAGEYGIS